MKPLALPIVFPLALTLSFGVLACKRGKNNQPMDINQPEAQDKRGVCVMDGLALRAAVGKSGKFMSNLNLGEEVQVEGSPDKDEAGKEYLKVQLSDGKAGWVALWGLVPKARVGVTMEDTTLYRRPDLLTQSEHKIPFMTVVAVTQQKEGWFEVTSENRKLSGWIRKGSLAQSKEDVAAAVLATKKLREKDGLEKEQKIEAILTSTPYPTSFFIQKLREQAAALSVAPPRPVDGGEEKAE